MLRRPALALLLAATLAAPPASPAAASDPRPPSPVVTRAAARTVTAPTDALRDTYGLEPFHAKWVDMRGIPVLGSTKTHDVALLEAAYLMDRMLPRRDILDGLIASRVRFVVMAHTEMTTDVPEHADLTPAAFWDKRARGLGATDARRAVSCGEENLLGFPGDPYATENILVHEFAHAIHEMGLARADPTFDTRLRGVYEDAMAEGLWRGTYAATNHKEYWAEATQSWFDTNRENDDVHGPVDTRSELKEHDPRVAKLLQEVFGDTDWRYTKPTETKDPQEKTRPHMDAYNSGAAPTFAWPEAVTAAATEHARIAALGVRREGEPELAWLRRRADQHDSEAQFTLATRYQQGRGVEKDEKQALRWFLAAAELGDPRGLAWVGRLRWLGLAGLDRSYAAARPELLAAAKHRVATAQFDLGRMALRGDPTIDIPPDPIEALMWFDLARRRLHRGATAEWKRLQATLPPEQLEAARQRARTWTPAPD